MEHLADNNVSRSQRDGKRIGDVIKIASVDRDLFAKEVLKSIILWNCPLQKCFIG